MVVISFTKSEILLLVRLLSESIEPRYYEVVEILKKFLKGFRSRLQKKLCQIAIDKFMKNNKITRLGVYKR